jgi:predicted tellurium resistance membrane protein TerC
MGWFGTVWLLAAYALFVKQHPLVQGARYLLLNTIGTLLMVPDMVHKQSWAMVAFQLVWIGIGMRGIWRARFPVKLNNMQS